MTRVGVRRRRGTGHQLRDEVLRAATDLLARLGDVDALTMRAVAAAAGVTPPSVYRHFPDKATLVRTVVAAGFDEFSTAIQTPTAHNPDAAPIERLAALALAYIRWGLAHPGQYRLLFSATNAGPAGLGIDEGGEHPGASSFQALVDAISACLPAHGDRAAALPLAIELWASLHGIVDLRITKPEMPWPEPTALIDPALAAVLTATRPEPDTDRRPPCKHSPSPP